MGFINYSVRFKPGTVASGADIDTAFTEVKNAVSSLTASNFRRHAGFSSTNRDTSSSVCVVGGNINRLEFSQLSTDSYISVCSYPHSFASESFNGLTKGVPSRYAMPFKVVSIQAAYDSIQNSSTTDSVEIKLAYIKSTEKALGFEWADPVGGEIGGFPAATIRDATLDISNVVAMQLFVYIKANASVTANRRINNLRAWATLEVPHIA